MSLPPTRFYKLVDGASPSCDLDIMEFLYCIDTVTGVPACCHPTECICAVVASIAERNDERIGKSFVFKSREIGCRSTSDMTGEGSNNKKAVDNGPRHFLSWQHCLIVKPSIDSQKDWILVEIFPFSWLKVVIATSHTSLGRAWWYRVAAPKRTWRLWRRDAPMAHSQVPVRFLALSKRQRMERE